MFKRISEAFGRLAADIQRETAEWKIRCTACGRQKSLAAVGGVRYGAFGTKHTLGYCSGCKGLRMLKIYRSAEAAAVPPRGPNLSA